MLVEKKPHITRLCAPTAQMANSVLTCVKISMASRSREVILPLYFTLVRLHLESSFQLWSSQHRKDMDLLERVQRKATKMIRGKAEIVGAVQLREGKAPGRPYCSLSVPKGGLRQLRRTCS